MNITREVMLWLETQTTLVVGVDMFQGKFPTGETGLVFKVVGGDENESLMNYAIVHITAIAIDYDTGNDSLQEVWELLSHSTGMTLLNTEKIHNSTPMKYPSFITTNEHDQYVFTCSVNMYFTRT